MTELLTKYNGGGVRHPLFKEFTASDQKKGGEKC